MQTLKYRDCSRQILHGLCYEVYLTPGLHQLIYFFSSSPSLLVIKTYFSMVHIFFFPWLNMGICIEKLFGGHKRQCTVAVMVKVKQCQVSLPSFLRALAVVASAIPALPWQSHRGLKLGEHALESIVMDTFLVGIYYRLLSQKELLGYTSLCLEPLQPIFIFSLTIFYFYVGV